MTLAPGSRLERLAKKIFTAARARGILQCASVLDCGNPLRFGSELSQKAPVIGAVQNLAVLNVRGASSAGLRRNPFTPTLGRDDWEGHSLFGGRGAG